MVLITHVGHQACHGLMYLLKAVGVDWFRYGGSIVEALQTLVQQIDLGKA